MAPGKDFPLSITLRTVNRATSGIKRVNDELEKARKPFRDLGKEMSRFSENAGLGKIAAGFSGIGRHVKSLAIGLGAIGAAGIGAGVAFKGMVDEFDAIGDKADALGMGVAQLVQLRYAAQLSGGEVEKLDSSMERFNKTLGEAGAGSGALYSLLKRASPALLKQVKAAKSSEEAFDLLADAMAKLGGNQAKKAALAAAAGFDPSLIPMLSRGSAELRKLRTEVRRSAEEQERAARASGEIGDAWDRMGAQLSGVKAIIVTSLGPAFRDLTARAGAFLEANSGAIAAWVTEFGEKLPARLEKLGQALLRIWNEAIMPVVRAVGWLVEKLGGAESAVKILITAFVAFKALQIGSSIIQITQGLVGMAGAARRAAAAIAGIKAPGVGGGGGGGSRVGRFFKRAGRLAVRAGGVAAAGAGALGAKLAMTAGAAGAAATAGAAIAGGAIGGAVGTGADWLVGKATGRSLSDRLAGVGGDHELVGRVNQIMNRHQLAAKNAEASVKVEFTNAPAGTRVTTEPGSTADVDLSVGYQMLGMGW